MKRILFLIVLLSLLLTSCASKQLTVRDAWVRSSTNGGNSAIYMVIDNPTDEDDVLLIAHSDIASAIELHMSKMSDEGTMMMQQQEYIPVPAGSTVGLEPGGLHIMLINLNKDLVAGDTIHVTLTFQNAGEITVEVLVKNP